MLSQSRILIASSMVTASFAVTPAVFAQAFVGTFTADIPGICQEVVNNPGTLASVGAPPVNFISANLPGGVRADIDVDCNIPGQITVNTVTPIAFPAVSPDPANTEYFVEVNNNTTGTAATGNGVAPGGGAVTSLTPITFADIDAGPNDLDVNLEINREPAGDTFIGGIYDYEVQFTITP